MNDLKTFLTFYVNQPDANWDGSHVTVKNPADDTAESLGGQDIATVPPVRDPRRRGCGIAKSAWLL